MSTGDITHSGAFAEWSKARDVIEKFDDRRQDLRKYGFTFIAGLLTAQALLGNSLPGFVKLAVILVSLILIIGLRLTEKDYELFQKAAALRAGILENQLNLELTKTISIVYRNDSMWDYVDVLYAYFLVGTGLLGFAILYKSALMYVAIAVTAMALVVLWLMRRIKVEGVDISADKSMYVKGDIVTITLTNLTGMKLPLPTDRPIWGIETLDKKVIKQGTIQTSISIEPGESYVWQWPTDATDIQPDMMYRLVSHVVVGAKPDWVFLRSLYFQKKA